ncbi:MAG: helix-turn-helix domain-containing protein [bacterium]
MVQKPSLDTLGKLITEKRGEIGVRKAAAEIGISAATLSRVENGHLPDLSNFQLICKWLSVDPNSILGFSSVESKESEDHSVAHFKKKNTTSPETATALAQMILRAEQALKAEESG